MPKCMGGEGASRTKHPNIVWLLPHEHLIAHYLLCLKYPDNYKLGLALREMLMGRNCSRLYLDLLKIDTDIDTLAQLYEDAKIMIYNCSSQRSKELAMRLTPEERHLYAMKGGQGMKKRLETDIDFYNQTVERLIAWHADMPFEVKKSLYEKSSKSLKEYYQSEEWQRTRDERISKNTETNKIVSKQWRENFANLFGHTPEWFRKYGKMAEVCALYKEIRDLPNAADLAKTFTAECDKLQKNPYKCKNPQERANKIQKRHQSNRNALSKYIYKINDIIFGNAFDLSKYLEKLYKIKFSSRVMDGLTPDGWKYDTRCRLELKKLCDELSTKIIVIEKGEQNEC